jgi:hypothetical protein
MYQEILKYEQSFQVMYPRQALWGNPDNENVVHSSKSYVACICYQLLKLSISRRHHAQALDT